MSRTRRPRVSVSARIARKPLARVRARADLEARLERLEAESEIRRLHARYCRAVDEKDLGTIRETFTKDAYLQVIPWSEHRGRRAIKEFFSGYFASGWVSPRHYITNQVIAVDGSRATAFSYLFETVEKNGESVVGCGTYEDRLRREGGVWRFEEKIIAVLFMTPIQRGWAGPDKIVSWA
jgi:ketosteroid isomerase-like protein